MNRTEFEQAARQQNIDRANEVKTARETGKPCQIEVMLAFGGVEYCRTHRVMGTCTYGKAAR